MNLYKIHDVPAIVTCTLYFIYTLYDVYILTAPIVVMYCLLGFKIKGNFILRLILLILFLNIFLWDKAIVTVTIFVNLSP